MWTPREHGVPTPRPEGWAKSRLCRRLQPRVRRGSCRHSVARPALLNQKGPRTASSERPLSERRDMPESTQSCRSSGRKRSFANFAERPQKRAFGLLGAHGNVEPSRRWLPRCPRQRPGGAARSDRAARLSGRRCRAAPWREKKRPLRGRRDERLTLRVLEFDLQRMLRRAPRASRPG